MKNLKKPEKSTKGRIRQMLWEASGMVWILIIMMAFFYAPLFFVNF